MHPGTATQGARTVAGAPGPGARVIILSDLDDTLFQTARKLPGGAPGAARLAARAGNGAHSYMTSAQAALFAWLDLGLVVPVTARGSEAFSRVALAFRGPAIVANGATILAPDGAPDAAWAARTAAALQPARATLARLPGAIAQASRAVGLATRGWLVEEPGLGGVYAVAKVEPGAPEARLRELPSVIDGLLDGALGVSCAAATPSAPPDWRLHLNGNNLAFIPAAISKARASAHVLATLRAQAGDGSVTIGVGDSATDLDFMRLCDLWMTPSGSQIDGGLREPAFTLAGRDAASGAAAG